MTPNRPRPALAAAFQAAVEQVRAVTGALPGMSAAGAAFAATAGQMQAVTGGPLGSAVGRAFAALGDRDPDLILALARAKLDLIAHFDGFPAPTPDEDDARDDSDD